MFWIIVEKVGILGGLISLILLFKQYLWPYLLRVYYYPKIDKFLEIYFDPSTIKAGGKILPLIAFPNPEGKINDDRFFQLKKKYKLTLKKVSLYFPQGVFVKSHAKEWSYPDLRERGYLTFDLFPIDPRLKRPEVLQLGEALGLGTLGFEIETKKPGEYKIIAHVELLLETKIGHVRLIIQKEPVIKITTI